MHQEATWLHAFNTGEGPDCICFPALCRNGVHGRGFEWGVALWTSCAAHKGSDYIASYLRPMMPVVVPRLAHFHHELIKASEQLRNAFQVLFCFSGWGNPTNGVNATVIYGVSNHSLMLSFRLVFYSYFSPEVSCCHCVSGDKKITCFF